MCLFSLDDSRSLIRSRYLTRLCGLTLVAWLVAGASAQAAIVLDNTRVIFEADGHDVSVRLANNGDSPRLVQVWLDEGDMQAKPESIEAPALISPSTARIDASRTQVIRFLPAPSALPADRETLLWLNILEIPPEPSGAAADKNVMQIAFRNRVKFFYRPESLAGSSVGAMRHLSFRRIAARDGTPPRIALVNASPYYVTLGGLSVDRAGTALGRLSMDADWMAAPFSTLTVPIRLADGVTRLPDQATIRYSIINDQGGRTAGHAELEAPSG